MLWRSSDPIPEEDEEEEEEEDVDAGELEEEDAEEEYPYTAGHTVPAPARRHTEKAPDFLTFLQEQCGSDCFEARRRRKRTNAGMPIHAELTLDEDDAYAEAAQLELYGEDADDFEIRQTFLSSAVSIRAEAVGHCSTRCFRVPISTSFALCFSPRSGARFG